MRESESLCEEIASLEARSMLSALLNILWVLLGGLVMTLDWLLASTCLGFGRAHIHD